MPREPHHAGVNYAVKMLGSSRCVDRGALRSGALGNMFGPSPTPLDPSRDYGKLLPALLRMACAACGSSTSHHPRGAPVGVGPH